MMVAWNRVEAKKIEAEGFEIHFEKGLGKTSVDWPLNISSL